MLVLAALAVMLVSVAVRVLVLVSVRRCAMRMLMRVSVFVLMFVFGFHTNPRAWPQSQVFSCILAPAKGCYGPMPFLCYLGCQCQN